MAIVQCNINSAHSKLVNNFSLVWIFSTTVFWYILFKAAKALVALIARPLPEERQSTCRLTDATAVRGGTDHAVAAIGAVDRARHPL